VGRFAVRDLSAAHWQTLAILDAVSGEVSLDVLERLSPLEPQDVHALVRRSVSAGIVTETKNRGLILSPGVSLTVKRRLSRINTKKRLASIAARVQRLDPKDGLTADARISLLLKAGLDYDAALLAQEEAEKCVREGNASDALGFLERAYGISAGRLGDAQWDMLFILIVNELCRLTINAAGNIRRIPSLLEQERPVAERLGDLRTLARIDLVSGLYHYVMGDTAQGLENITSGLQKAEELGDEDIILISSEFRGIYYYLKGMYKEAVDTFDQVMRVNSLPSGGRAPTFLPEHLASSSALGYISALLGQYHRAVGLLDSHWRRARMRKNDRNACFYEALLGIVLIITGRRTEAYSHLKSAQKEALEIDNRQALHVAKKGLAYHAYFEGRLEDAYWITMSMPHTESIGPQYNWPVHLEMLYAFERQDLLPPMPSLAFEQEITRVLDGPNHHLRGVALRIRALQAQERGDPHEDVLGLLRSSESELLLTGDPVELAKTRAEMARVQIARKDRPAARNYALMAWEGLSGYGQDFFPDDLVPLLRVGAPRRPGPRRQDLIERFTDLMDGFIPSTDGDEFLNRLVAAASRFFGADRGGLFWSAGGRDAGRPALRASYNLERSDISAEPFRESLRLIFKTFRNKEPLILKGVSGRRDREGGSQGVSVFCLPVTLKGEVRGVLYLDNFYTETGDDTEALDRDTALRLARQVSFSIERILRYAGMIETDRSRAASAHSSGDSDDAADRIIGSSPVMEVLLALSDQAAQSDATVLITGETGVGKELLARRIHDKSPRKDSPFVPVNLASIPETLVESELFGHEKGAFTGADRQKPGRIELAHRGTLFIDEIGDVPPGVQVKLLRVIQEKSFSRVGGTRTLISDFRLVAATNRDLARDAASGRFRQDLYFRLNVVPLLMPPLRDRGEDVVDLAQEFLRRYARKYHRALPAMTGEDVKALMAYSWPGNVRELKNVIERCAILSSKDRLQFHLPSSAGPISDPAFAGTPSMDELQRRYILHVLDLAHGRIGGPGGAAEILGMKRTTLQARMRKLGIGK
jgi:transcriptional regulator with GAF, ATPase, and Fis domain/tetratricopeptide (TPR) repeat protein